MLFPSRQVDTYAAAVDIGPGERPLQIWIIALAVSIGICLLILLILCLWKVSTSGGASCN